MGKTGEPAASEAARQYNLSIKQPYHVFMREVQAYYIAEKLAESGGNQAEAARRAGMNKDTFHKKVRSFALRVGRATVVRGT